MKRVYRYFPTIPRQLKDMADTFYLLFFLFLSVISFGLPQMIAGQTVMGPYMLYDNHYLIDKYVINPAFAGNKYYPKAFVGAQKMELQIHNSPTQYVAGMHSRLGIKRNFSTEYESGNRSSRNAVGGMLFADNNGPYQTVGAKLDYVYHIPLNEKSTTLSLGLGGMLFSKRIRLDNYTLMDNDPLIAENAGNRVMIPDVNAGAVFSHKQLYVGFSVSQLLENSYHSSDYKYTPAKVYRNFYLLAGYRFVYSRFEFEPSVVVGRNLATVRHGNNGNFVDANVEFFLKPIVFTLSYRIDGYMSTMLLYRAGKLELGVRTELFSTKSLDARCNSVGLMVAYTFLPSQMRVTSNKR